MIRSGLPDLYRSDVHALAENSFLASGAKGSRRKGTTRHRKAYAARPLAREATIRHVTRSSLSSLRRKEKGAHCSD